MQAWNLSVNIEHRKGELARVCDALGKERINIEGLAAHITDKKGWVQILVTDETSARRVFDGLGIKIEKVQECWLDSLPNRPGALGELCRKLSEGGVNLTSAYTCSDNRVVLGADDMATLRKVWQAMPAGATR